MKTILKATNLTKVYENNKISTTVLKGINLEIEEGSFVGIMGPSGSGKTTLLNILSTIDTATSGNIILKDQDLVKLNNSTVSNFRLENIGFVFQDFNLLDNMCILDNIALPLVLDNNKYTDIKKKTYDVAKILGIENHLKKHPYELSGGQKQRAATARALIKEPKILFADEPTGALDTKSASDLLNAFTKINKEKGTTIFMVTHDANAASYCDKVMFIKDGEIYSDIYKSDNRENFYQNILNNLSAIGGAM